MIKVKDEQIIAKIKELREKLKEKELYTIQLARCMNGEILVELKSEVGVDCYWVNAYLSPYSKEIPTTHFYSRSYKTLEEATNAVELISTVLKNFSLSKIGVYI